MGLICYIKLGVCLLCLSGVLADLFEAKMECFECVWLCLKLEFGDGRILHVRCCNTRNGHC